MRNYNEIERRTIALLARDGYQATTYLAINAYNDFFYNHKVEFRSEPSPVLLFYYEGDDPRDSDEMISLRNEIIVISKLIEQLEKEDLISFLQSASTNTLTEISGFQKDGLKSVSLSLDTDIADIILECLQKETYVSSGLKTLADEISVNEWIPTRRYDTSLYFEKQEQKSSRSDLKSSVTTPEKLPCFVLCHNKNWDDNSYYNWYCLHYFDENGNWEKVGELRLMTTEGVSWSKIPDHFNYLNDTFCSLGISLEYYLSLFHIFGIDKSKDILFALQDCAIYPGIKEKFKDYEQFKLSLTRDSIESENCFRMAKFILNGQKVQNAFNFTYSFHPPYNSPSKTDWIVELNQNVPSFMRCIGVIGENGVGKTYMLKSFISDIISGKYENFNNKRPPIFSSVISICSTPFDSIFRLQGGDATIPYNACCVEQNLERTIEQIKSSFNKIVERGRVNGEALNSLYVNSLKEELPTEKIDDVFVYLNSGIGIMRRYELKEEKLPKFIRQLSSGQLQTMMLLTHIYEHVNFDTLFIIDEPEVHLHPNAVLNFFKRINIILDQFQSFAIIVTHTPLVVREMIGRNVFVLKRMDDDDAYIGHCDCETFGEDIFLLYKNIFGYDESNSCFQDYIRDEMHKRPGYDELIEGLRVQRLSMNSRFTIRNILEKDKLGRNEKQ